MRDARRWKPHILSGAPPPVVSAERPGWTRRAPVVTLALRPPRIGVAGAHIKSLKLHAPFFIFTRSRRFVQRRQAARHPHHWRRLEAHTVCPCSTSTALRPTPDRVRETLFNWLGQDLEGRRCLDLFAGSGALGFEAASRGAARVLMVERNARAAAQLRANQERLAARTIEIAEADGLRLAASLAPGSFDVVFLDPPFDAGLLDKALALAVPLISAEGFLYVETGEALELEGNETLAAGKSCGKGKRAPSTFICCSAKIRNNARSITSAGRFAVTRAVGADGVGWTL